MTARPLAVLLVAAAIGCAAPKPVYVDFSEARKNFRARDYQAVFDAWTRHAKVVQDVGTVIEAWVTLKSWEWRQAYIETYAETYRLPDEERATLNTAQLDAWRRQYEFHVVAQTTDHRWNDLEQKASPWRVTLVDGAGSEIAPTSIEVLRLPEIYENQFFPKRTPFSRTYAIRFDRSGPSAEDFGGPETGRITLRIAGPLGTAEMAWLAR